MSATVLHLPDGNRGRQLLAELHGRLPSGQSAELRIRSYAGQALLFVPDEVWRETWIEELVSRHGATVVAFDVPAAIEDRETQRIVVESADPADAELRETVAALLLRHRLTPMPEVGNAEASSSYLLRAVAEELAGLAPDASIEVVSPDVPAAATAGDSTLVWRISRAGRGSRAEGVSRTQGGSSAAR